jgi:hypothetical protein
MSDAALNVADQFWLRRFNIVFPFLPPGSKTSSIWWGRNCKKRGNFQHEDEGRTLGENLGLPRRKIVSLRPN